MSAPLKEQLAKTQKKLKDLEAEYQEFVYIVTHDLSSPFRTIEGFSSIILKDNEGQFDKKTLEHFDHIQKGSAKGKAILSALLTLSHINTNAADFKDINCNDIVSQVINNLSHLIEDKNAHIDVCPLPTISADSKQISSVFHNLLHNALIYHAINKAPKITINTDEDETHWHFSITDNGTGVKDNLTDRVFTALYRGVKDDNHPGMGIGLTATKKILQRHGGNVWVETEIDKGSTFSFTIAKELAGI